MSIREQLTRIRSRIRSEDVDYAENIRQWFPISVVIGIVVGFVMTLFFVFTVIISNLLNVGHPIIGMVIGGLILWILVKIGFEKTEENGMTYVITKKHAHEEVPLRQTQEFIGAGISIGSGLPVGREGPALIIGSAIATRIAKWRNIEESQLHEAITIGSAAATGSLFQAPFGSAVFAAEVPYKEDSDEPILMAGFVASVIAAVTLRLSADFISAHLLEIDLHLFRIGQASLEINILNTVLAFFLGILIGLLGRAIISLFYYYKDHFLSRFTVNQGLIIGLVLGIGSILIGLILYPDLYLAKGSASFDAIADFIGSSHPNLLWYLLLALVVQIIATIAIVGAGFPGGIFSPTLAIGAISGIIFALVLDQTGLVTVTAWAIVGMSASHAAMTKTPIASILLVLEITNMPPLIIPLILANISSYIVSGSSSLYQGQIRSRDALMLRQLREYDQMEYMTVEQLMTPEEKVYFASPTMELDQLEDLMIETHKRTFPVLDENQVVGIISTADVTRGISQGNQIVNEVMTREVVTVKRGQTARQALYIILQNDVERVPVVSDAGDLVGILTISDILRGQSKMINRNRKMNKTDDIYSGFE